MSLYSFALIHAKSKTRFSSGKPRNIINSIWNVYMIQNSWQNCFTLFDCNLYFNVQTINCMQYSEPVVIQTWLQSCNEINTHMETLSSKTQQCPLIERCYLVLNKEKRKQGNKKGKLTESLHLTVNGKKVEWQHDIGLRNFALTKSLGNHKAALNEKPTDSPQWFFIHSLIYQFSFENMGNLAVCDKDYRDVWTPRKYATDAICWISSKNPAKISHNYT